MSNYNENTEKKQVDTVSVYENKKIKNHELVSFLMGKVSDKGMARVDECGANLLFVANQDKSKARLWKGFFCNHKFCPTCSWRSSRKQMIKLSVVMSAIQEEYKYEYLFVTLTTPNVKADKLGDEIKHFNNSFSKLMRKKRFRGWGDKRKGESYKGFVKGYMKKVEVTYNDERDDYNPHLHVLMAVKPSYFKKDYLSKAEWLDEWRAATGQPEIEAIDIVRVKREQNNKTALEMAKYVAKDSDYLLNQEVFDTFFSGLKNKRIIVYAGIMKEYANRYDIGELDKYKVKDNEVYVYILMAKFNFELMKYERRYRIMTDEERKIIDMEE